MNYLVVFERSADGTVWARVPDLPGCYSCGDTQEEVKSNIKEAIDLHIEGLKETGQPIPEPSSFGADLIEV